MVGSGVGKRNGRLLFVCKRGYAWFVPIESVILEENFDEAATNKTLDQEGEDELSARSVETSNKDNGTEGKLPVKQSWLDAYLLISHWPRPHFES